MRTKWEKSHFKKQSWLLIGLPWGDNPYLIAKFNPKKLNYFQKVLKLIRDFTGKHF